MCCVFPNTTTPKRHQTEYNNFATTWKFNWIFFTTESRSRYDITDKIPTSLRQRTDFDRLGFCCRPSRYVSTVETNRGSTADRARPLGCRNDAQEVVPIKFRCHPEFYDVVEFCVSALSYRDREAMWQGPFLIGPCHTSKTKDQDPAKTMDYKNLENRTKNVGNVAPNSNFAFRAPVCRPCSECAVSSQILRLRNDIKPNITTSLRLGSSIEFFSRLSSNLVRT